MSARNEKSLYDRLVGSEFVRRDLGLTLMALLDILMVAFLFAMVNYAASRPGSSLNKRKDWTALSDKKKVYALSPKTKRFLKDLNKPVQVYVFVAPPGGQTEFMYEDIKELLTRMQARSKYISVEHINIDTEQKKAVELIKKHKLLTFLRDRDAFASSELGNAVGGLVVFISDKRKKAVNFFDTVKYKQPDPRSKKKDDYRIEAFKGEEMFLNALITVTQQRQPRICFTGGHGEASADGFSALDLKFAAEELKRQNFVSETVQKISGQVPVRCDILVVAAPQIPLQESEVSAIQAYLDKGGKLVLMTRTLDLEGKTWSRTGLEDLVARCGIRIEDAVTHDGTKALQSFRMHLSVVGISWAAQDGWASSHPIGKAMQGKVLRVDSARALSVQSTPEIKAEAVLSTASSEEAWGERDLYGRLSFDAKKDIKSPVPIIAAARESKKNGARVVVLGSWLLLANYKLDPNSQAIDYAKELLLNIFNWLAEQESLVALAPRKPEHIKLELTQKQVAKVGWLVLMLFPIGAILLGVLVWVAPSISSRRSRRAERGSPDRGSGAGGSKGGEK